MSKTKLLRDFDRFFSGNKDKVMSKLIIEFIKEHIKTRKITKETEKTYTSTLISHLRCNYKLDLNYDYIKEELKK
jgi:hypothetical protein